MKTKETTLEILFFLLVSCIILSGVWYVYFTSSQADNPICSDELKRCPDGTIIKLGGPMCSYPMCPAKTESPAVKNQNPTPNQFLSQTQPMSPQEVARSFYSWYQGLTPEQKRKQPFAQRRDLTDNFKARLDQAAGNSDPLLLCGAGKLDNSGIGSLSTGDNRVLVSISLLGTLSSQKAEVELVDSDGTWQIDEVFCQAASTGPSMISAPPVAVPDNSQTRPVGQ